MRGTPAAWRLALLLLPRAFRARHGEEMEAALAEHLAGRGRLGRVRVWTGAVVDTLKVAARLGWAARRRRGGSLEASLDGLRRDAGFAFRALRRRPGFALVAVLTLGVGLGAITAIFSVVNGVLLRPLPYAAADRIGILWHEFGDGAQNLPAVHPLDVRDYRDWSRTFETFILATGREWILGGEEDPEMVDVGLVEAGFFEFFGARPLLGRTIRGDEDEPGRAPVVVLSHRLWQRRFGGDLGVVGRAIDLAGARMEVVGVMPPEFRLHLPGEAFLLRDAEAWVSLRLDPERTPPRNFTAFTGFGRLRPETSFARAQEELEVLGARLRERHPEHAASNLRVRVVPLLRDVVKGAERILLLLFGAVGFVLLISCANVANLALVRGQARGSEMALRSALGARRGSLVRLALLESVVLAAAGAALGLLLAAAGLAALSASVSGTVPRLETVGMDGSVLVFAAAAGTLSAALFGVLPALRARDGDPARALHVGGRTGEGPGGRRLRDLLVVGEVAASLVLLVGTGLMVRSFAALGSVDPGFATEGRLTLRLTLPLGAFPDAGARLAFQQELFEELRALPAVTSVAAVSQLPLTGSGPLQPYAYDEETASNWESVTADRRHVTADFFGTMGARMVEGRAFTGLLEADRGTAIIDDRLAARAFPGRSAVGQRLQVDSNGAPEAGRYVTVVGVVEHLRLHDLSRPHLTQIYLPGVLGPSFSVVVQTSGDPAALVSPMRTIVARLAPGAPVQGVRTLEEVVAGSLAPVRLALALMALFGTVALLLASVGIFGVLSYAVSRRTREIGVRMALGQAPAQARRAVMVQGGRLVAVAVVVGLAAAALLSRAASNLLFGVEPLDPATYAATSVLLACVALLACWIPARRATRVDPVRALRE